MEKPIQFDYKCTKCHQKILPPVYQCYEGHLLCELCSLAVSSCPVCHDPLPASKRIRSIEIEKIITQVQDHPCPYKNRGCVVEVKYDELDDHKLDCSHALLPFCSILTIDGCKRQVPVTNLVKHLQNDHCRSVYLSETKINKSFTVRFFPPSQNFQKTYCQFLLVRIEREDSTVLFVIRIKYRKGQMTWTPCVIGGNKTAARYSCSVSLGTKKTPSLSWKGRVFSLMSSAIELETSFTTTLAYVKSEVDTDQETYCAKITFSENNVESALKSCGRKVWTSLTTQPEWSRGIRFSMPLLAGASSSTSPCQIHVKASTTKQEKDKKLVKTMSQKIRDTNKKEIQEFYFWLSQAFGVTEKPKAKDSAH